MIKITNEDIKEFWSVHEGGEMHGKLWYYVGPRHGRIAFCNYVDKKTAKHVVQMHNWLIKKLGLLKDKKIRVKNIRLVEKLGVYVHLYDNR